MHKIISKSILNLEFVLKLEERMNNTIFEKLRKIGGKGNKKKKKLKEFRVEKYAKKKEFEVYAY